MKAARIGMLTEAELRDLVARGEIDTVLVVFPDLYGRFMGKRVPARFFLDQVAAAGMHACNYLLTVDMEMDVVAGYQLASWEQGYGDFHCVPDLRTLRRLSWLDRSAQVICDLDMQHRPVAVAPRTMLKRQLERAAAAGHRVMGATELEYYLFRDSYEQARAKRFEDLDTFGWYIEDYHMLQGTREESFNGALRRHLEASGIPVESSKGEWGPGQHELNIRYCDALEMSDRHCLYKQAAKEIAIAQGISITFMAKWRHDLAGSSMHLHLSLWDEDGDRPSFAPTTIAWSVDNRTAGIRVVGEGSTLRIECRIPGADANPYLAFAASIAAGLDGIARQTEPPPIFTGDVYVARDLPKVPASLPEAVAEMEASAMLREAFGPEVIEHYAHFFRTEQRKLDATVTSWERERYFERA